MPIGKSNPLFTRSEKHRAQRKVSKAIRGAARRGFARLLGIPLSPGLGGGSSKGSQARGGTRRRSHRTARGSAGSVRGDVISGLRNLGYKQSQAERMVPQPASGESFDSLFRRAVSKNPAELVIFGNPSKVYGKVNVSKVARQGNPIPAALVGAFESAAGSKLFDVVSSGRKKKRNPHQVDKAKELFEDFHQRGSSGVFEMQRSAKMRKTYAIIGPLVAIGTNAEKFDELKRRSIAKAGKKAWEDHVVEHFDQLPHMAFLTGPQIAHVKRILADPDQYLKDCPMLACSPNRKTLYILANDIDIDLSQFDIDAGKDLVDLGEATFVVYVAKKPADVREWVHTFGDEGGMRPRLAYSRLGKELLFIGGSYTVEAPGILN